MKTFVEFVQDRQDDSFNEGLTTLLMPVVEGHMSMDDLIESVILPVFAENAFVENEHQLMNEFLGKLWDRLRGRGQAPAADPAGDAAANARWAQNQAANRAGGQQFRSPNERASVEMDARRQAALKPILQKMQALVKSDLAPAVDKIADAMKQDAYKTGNRHLFQAANGFKNTIMKTAQNMSFKFKRVAGGGRDEFNAARRDSRYSPEQQKAMRQKAAAMKQRADYRAQGLDDEGYYKLAQTPEEKAAAAQVAMRPAGSANANPRGIDQFSSKQRARIERERQRRSGRANVVGGVGGNSAAAASA